MTTRLPPGADYSAKPTLPPGVYPAHEDMVKFNPGGIARFTEILAIGARRHLEKVAKAS